MCLKIDTMVETANEVKFAEMDTCAAKTVRLGQLAFQFNQREVLNDRHCQSKRHNERPRRRVIRVLQTRDAPGRLTFWACADGWTLDGMEFIIFPLVIGTLMSAWGMDG